MCVPIYNQFAKAGIPVKGSRSCQARLKNIFNHTKPEGWKTFTHAVVDNNKVNKISAILEGCKSMLKWIGNIHCLYSKGLFGLKCRLHVVNIEHPSNHWHHQNWSYIVSHLKHAFSVGLLNVCQPLFLNCGGDWFKITILSIVGQRPKNKDAKHFGQKVSKSRIVVGPFESVL